MKGPRWSSQRTNITVFSEHVLWLRLQFHTNVDQSVSMGIVCLQFYQHCGGKDLSGKDKDVEYYSLGFFVLISQTFLMKWNFCSILL